MFLPNVNAYTATALVYIQLYKTNKRMKMKILCALLFTHHSLRCLAGGAAAWRKFEIYFLHLASISHKLLFFISEYKRHDIINDRQSYIMLIQKRAQNTVKMLPHYIILFG